MKLVKYCTEEHNLATKCHTLQLGTFQYYRELDPSFSIADVKEGYIHYLGPEKEITVGAAEMNAITGGAMVASDPTTAGTPKPPKNPGPVEIIMRNHTVVIGEDGKLQFRLTSDPSDLDVRVYYPNCYIFCVSVLENGQEPDPRKVSRDYDSFYEIKQSETQAFIQTVTQAISQQIRLVNMRIEGALAEMPLFGLNQFQVLCFHREVEYVKRREIYLNEPSDFTKNRFYEIYLDSIFKKHESYSGNREYRFVFVITHLLSGPISVKKEPILLQMKPVADQIGLP